MTNFAKQGEAPLEQLDPTFQTRFLEQDQFNLQEWTARAQADPSWLDPRSGNSPVTPASATWEGPFTGDPFRYPQAHGPDGDQFYANEADVIPVVFYDRDCARLSGRVWAPKGSDARSMLPNVVFISGSVQVTEPAYWPFPQALVRAGYAVMSYDARGQGRSDWQSPDGQLGSNANVKVFWEGGVDAIDFFRSTPARPYPHNLHCAGSYPTAVTAFNPIWDRIDPARLGVTGQSAGAIASSVIQGYGAAGAEPWPGQMDTSNPVKVIVALDSLLAPNGVGGTPTENVYLPPEVADEFVRTVVAQGNLPRFGVRVPALSIRIAAVINRCARTFAPAAESSQATKIVGPRMPRIVRRQWSHQ